MVTNIQTARTTVGKFQYYLNDTFVKTNSNPSADLITNLVYSFALGEDVVSAQSGSNVKYGVGLNMNDSNPTPVNGLTSHVIARKRGGSEVEFKITEDKKKKTRTFTIITRSPSGDASKKITELPYTLTVNTGKGAVNDKKALTIKCNGTPVKPVPYKAKVKKRAPLPQQQPQKPVKKPSNVKKALKAIGGFFAAVGAVAWKVIKKVAPYAATAAVAVLIILALHKCNANTQDPVTTTPGPGTTITETTKNPYQEGDKEIGKDHGGQDIVQGEDGTVTYVPIDPNGTNGKLNGDDQQDFDAPPVTGGNGGQNFTGSHEQGTGGNGGAGKNPLPDTGVKDPEFINGSNNGGMSENQDEEHNFDAPELNP